MIQQEQRSLLALLIGAVKAADGVLRIKASLVRETDAEGLIEHYDAEANEYVLRFAPKGANVHFAGASHQVPGTGKPVQPQQRIAHQPTDAQLAAIEEQKAWARALANQGAQEGIEQGERPHTVFRTSRDQ
jgi:hypothetical protein